jgi:hyperosmotically inducible protein
MRTRTCLWVTLGFLLATGTVSGVAQTRAESMTIDDIQNTLLRLPYYGVFDFLAFNYEKGTVTLTGYAAHATLRHDAERAVRRIAHVDEIVNKIEDLPVSSNDDDLRWRMYYAIYNDPFLSRFAPTGGILWGHRHPMAGARFGRDARFPGMYPTGTYPIQIIVKNGHVTLMGMVDNEGDKTMAGIKARGVTGAFSVENELGVERRPT